MSLLLEWKKMRDHQNYTLEQRVRSYSKIFLHFKKNTLPKWEVDFNIRHFGVIEQHYTIQDIFQTFFHKIFEIKISMRDQNIKELPDFHNEKQLYGFIYVCFKNILKNLKKRNREINQVNEVDADSFIIDFGMTNEGIEKILNDTADNLRDINGFEADDILKIWKKRNLDCFELIQRIDYGYSYREMIIQFKEYNSIKENTLAQRVYNCRDQFNLFYQENLLPKL
jgi:hypothetical protein